jgi:hypothetical protein
MVRADRRVDLDLVALILDAKAEGLGELEPLDFWTRPIVYHVLSCDVFNWCSRRQVLVPKDVPLALDVYLRFLSEERLLTNGSDALSALLEPIRCYGGVGTLPDRCTCYELVNDGRSTRQGLR